MYNHTQTLGLTLNQYCKNKPYIIVMLMHIWAYAKVYVSVGPMGRHWSPNFSLFKQNELCCISNKVLIWNMKIKSIHAEPIWCENSHLLPRALICVCGPLVPWWSWPSSDFHLTRRTSDVSGVSPEACASGSCSSRRHELSRVWARA